METVWSLDICLTCDRQTSGEPYCSQACRLADLEPLASPSRSETASPERTTATTPLSSAFLPTAPSPTAGFFLPPAFDFAPYRRPSPPIPSRPSSSCSSGAAGGFSDSSNSSTGAFTPSSYRSHAGTLPAGAATPPPYSDNLSTQARQELRDYTNSFDTVRHFRRRLTS